MIAYIVHIIFKQIELPSNGIRYPFSATWYPQFVFFVQNIWNYT